MKISLMTVFKSVDMRDFLMIFMHLKCEVCTSHCLILFCTTSFQLHVINIITDRHSIISGHQNIYLTHFVVRAYLEM